jgi:hypothetical protein
MICESAVEGTAVSCSAPDDGSADSDGEDADAPPLVTVLLEHAVSAGKASAKINASILLFADFTLN